MTEKWHIIRGVRVFKAGTFVPAMPGVPMKFNAEDLEQLAKNFADLSQSVKPQLKLGHDDKDGMPSFGKVTRLYVDGDVLRADFEDVPKVVYEAITAGLYRQVSIEMSFDKSIGWYLTGVALLGADLPAVRGLPDLQEYLAARGITGTPGTLATAEQVDAMFSAADPRLDGQPPRQDKEKNSMDEKEFADMKVRLAEAEAAKQKAEADAAKFKADAERQAEEARKQAMEAAFAAAKKTAMEPFEKMVADKTLEPQLRDKIAAAFDAQGAKFSEGSELALPAALALELSQSVNLSAKPGATDDGSHDGDDRPDLQLSRAVFKVMAQTGKSYDEAVELACAADPSLARAWVGFTQEISLKGVN